MVNRLLREQKPKPTRNVLVVWMSDISSTVGSKTMSYGDEAWIPYDMAVKLKDDLKIIEYGQATIDALNDPDDPFTDVPEEMTGFVCPICLEEGKVMRFAKQKQLIGHLGCHVEGRGYSKGGKKKVGRKKGTTKRAIEMRRRKREREREKGAF